MTVQTWIKEPSKRIFDLSTAYLKAFIEKNGDAFRAFLTGVGFSQLSEKRYQFSKPATPAAEGEELNVLAGNIEVLETLLKTILDEEKKLA
jgi:hypothetical protein